MSTPINRHAQSKTRAGFTLVEVLVVISIVALLVSLLLPSLKQARDSTKATLCLSNQRQITFKIFQYFTDQRDWAPPRVLEPSYGYVDWMNRLVISGLFDPIPMTTSPIRPVKTSTSGEVRYCSEIPPGALADNNNILPTGYSHYMMPGELTGASYNNWATWLWNRPPIRYNQVIKPAGTMTLTETYYNVSTNTVLNTSENFNEFDGVNYLGYYRSRAGVNYQTNISQSNFRHMTDKVNFVFFDGHGETRVYNRNDPYSVSYMPYYVGGFGYLFGPLRGYRYDDRIVP